MKQIYFFRYIFLLLFICLSATVMAQTGTITGRIIDESSLPLPGATVTIQGTTLSAGADVNGYFKLSNAPAGAHVLVVSFIGYEPLKQTVTVNGTINVTLQLKPSSVVLNQVAVIGYGTVKKSDATGAIDVVTAKDLNKGAVNSVQDAISGKLAGVTVISNSGAPGNTSTIRIRGTTSLNASTDPLIVVDGVPLNNTIPGGSANILAAINPDDVENITVLKDASATAIYGSRGSSGVIMITTKRGTKKLTINYNTTASLSVIPKEVPVYNAQQFRNIVNETYPGQTAVSSLLGNANTDWQKQIYQNAFGNDQNLSIAGSTKNMPYRVSVGYDDADGILKTYNFQRTTVGINLDPSFFHNTLNVHVNLKGLYNPNNFSDQAAIGSAVNYDPTQPVYNGNTRYRGYTTWTTAGNTNINGDPVTLATANPVARLDETDNKSTSRRSIGNVQFDYKIPGIEGLRANLNLGYDYEYTFGLNNVLNNTPWVSLPVALGGQKDTYNTGNHNALAEFYLNYKRNLKSIKSTIDVTGGYSFSDFYTYGNSVTADYNETQVKTFPYKTDYKLISFFGRANYTFDDKYELTFTIRDDGTSRFGPQYRFGVFPAGAFSWKIMDEDFMKGSKVFSNLKLRLGYGTTGQQDLTANNNYPYQAVFVQSDPSSRYQFGNTFYYTLRPNAYDAGIKWESTTTSNVGIDFGFFNNRLTGSVDAYYKKTSNLLNSVAVPALTNFASSVLENVGDMENKGAELALNAIIISQTDWHWRLGYNISFNKNKITKLLNSSEAGYVQVNTNSGISGTTSGDIQYQTVGRPINSYYVFQQIYDKNGKPIEDGYVDRNHDGVINSADLYFDKSPDPTVTMGINSDVSYKRFDFSFSGRVSLGNYDYNNVAANSTYYGVYSSLGYLQNQTTAASLTQYKSVPLMTNQSDYYIQNASFFRMDNMNVGYTFPPYLKDRLKLRVSAGVQNVFVITPYKGLDPEISGGLDNNFFPRPRIYQLGLNANF
jgi:TonB-dependent starch-binding outer membrane protein SusC